MIGLLLLRRALSKRSCGLNEASPIAVEFDMGSVVPCSSALSLCGAEDVGRERSGVCWTPTPSLNRVRKDFTVPTFIDQSHTLEGELPAKSHLIVTQLNIQDRSTKPRYIARKQSTQR